MRPRRVGEVLDAAIKIYLGNARTLMALTATVVIPVQVVSAIVLLSAVPSGSDIPTGVFAIGHVQRPPSGGAYIGATSLQLVMVFIGTLLVTAACVKAVSDVYLDQPPGYGPSLRFALRRLPALFAMEILLILGLIVGFVAVILPGIWLYASWSVATPSLLIERLRPARALGRSMRLVRDRWWATSAILIVAVLMGEVVNGAIQGLLVAVVSLPSHPTLLAAVSASVLAATVGSVIVTPFTATVSTVLYYDLRVRHDGYDLQLMADELGLPAVAASASLGGGATTPEWGPASVGQPGGPPFWPPPPGWRPGQ